MHWDKPAARILLILSVVRVAVATPEIARQTSLDVDEDVTPASEKRGNPGDTPQDLYPVPQMDNELPTTSRTPKSQDDPLPESGTPQLHNDQPQTAESPASQDEPLPESGTLQLPNDQPQTAEPPASQDDLPPESGTPQLHNDQPQTSGPPPSQDDTSLVSGNPESHSGPPAGSKDPQLHDPPYPSLWPHTDWRPTGEIEEVEPSSQALYPMPQMDNDRPPASGAPRLQNDPLPATNNFISDPTKRKLKVMGTVGFFVGAVALVLWIQELSIRQSHGPYVLLSPLPLLSTSN